VRFFESPTGVRIDLVRGTGRGDGRDTFDSIEDVVGSRHDDTILGTSGPNEIFASTGDDSVFGRGGNDELLDSSGRDHFEGGAGSDDIHTTGCVSSSGGPTVCQSDAPRPDTLIGGPGNDTMSSGPGDDRLTGNGGNDWMVAGDGTDRLFGNDGDDTLHGGHAAGNDPEADDGNPDELDGGPGTDSCEGTGDTYTNCEGP
jgi:Ca2+-binding RTX toxin-like protein